MKASQLPDQPLFAGFVVMTNMVQLVLQSSKNGALRLIRNFVAASLAIATIFSLGPLIITRFVVKNGMTWNVISGTKEFMSCHNVPNSAKRVLTPCRKTPFTERSPASLSAPF